MVPGWKGCGAQVLPADGCDCRASQKSWSVDPEYTYDMN